MPKIPTYDTPAVQDSAPLNANTTIQPGAFRDLASPIAEKAGGGMLAAGVGMAKFANAENREENKVREAAAMDEAMALALNLRNGENGYSRLSGGDTLKTPGPDGETLDQRYGTQFDEGIKLISKKLDNDAQRDSFMLQSNQLRNQFVNGVSEHAAREFKAYSENVQKAGIVVGQGALANAVDAGMIEQAHNRISTAVDELAKSSGVNGDDAENIKATMLQNALSPGYTRLISNRIDTGQIENAKILFDAYKDNITPESRAHIEKALAHDSDLITVQSEVDKLMADGSLDKQSALTRVRELFSGETEVLAVREVETRFHEKHQSDVEGAKNVSTAAWAKVMQTGRMPTGTLFANLRERAPEEERQMRDWLDAKRRHDKAEAEGGAKTDPVKYYGLMQLAMDDAVKFSRLDLTKSLPYLSAGDFKHMVNLQSSLNNKDEKATREVAMLKQATSLIKHDLAAAGIDITPKVGSKDAAETALFNSKLIEQLKRKAETKGSALNDDEIKKVGVDLLRTGTESGSGVWGFLTKKVPGYRQDPNKLYIRTSFDDIPPNYRVELEKTYRDSKRIKFGVLLGDDKAEIERMYARGQKNGIF